MGLTLAVKKRFPDRNGRVVIVEATFDSSYPTGGEALTPADLRLKQIEHVGQEISSTGHLVVFDYAASKLMAFYGNYDSADGPLVEVPNATNLATVTVRLLVLGDHFSALKK